MKIYYLAFIFFLFESCASWRNTLIEKGDNNAAVQNAINDFLHTEKLYKKDSVYYVRIKIINDAIIGVSIIDDENKIAVITENKIDYSYKAFPTNYFEKNGKLFYWKDSTQKASEELIIKLSKMNRIDTAIINEYFPPRGKVDDSKKGFDYYFCKNNLRKYKKVHSKIAMGWYKIPKLECN